jgi:hypothetical protein
MIPVNVLVSYYNERAEMTASEGHYSASELAALWNLSLDTIRRIFENEPGVLVLGEDRPKRNRRRSTTLRIPESVAARVHRRPSKV